MSHPSCGTYKRASPISHPSCGTYKRASPISHPSCGTCKRTSPISHPSCGTCKRTSPISRHHYAESTLERAGPLLHPHALSIYKQASPLAPPMLHLQTSQFSIAPRCSIYKQASPLSHPRAASTNKLAR